MRHKILPEHVSSGRGNNVESNHFRNLYNAIMLYELNIVAAKFRGAANVNTTFQSSHIHI
jgi:hypothetical protein